MAKYDFYLRTAVEYEKKFFYTDSRNHGCIGHLRGYIDDHGCMPTSWDDHESDLKTDAFKAEFDGLIKDLKTHKEHHQILKDRKHLINFCWSGNGLALDDDGSVGIVMTTYENAYYIRLNPNRGYYNLYIYCYNRDALDTYGIRKGA